MTIIYSDDSDKIEWPETDSHDPNSKKYYYITYRPAERQDSKEYIKGMDVIVPPTSNGCMYECVSSGVSASSYTTFSSVEGGLIDDGTVKWKTKPLLCRLMDGDIINSSTWSGETGVTLDNPTILLDTITAVRVTATPAGASTFTITNVISVTRASGRQEEFSKSIVIPIKEL